MAKTKSVRAPTTSSLPYDLRIPSSTAALVRTLGKLSRPSLLELVLLWLSKPNVHRFPPFLAKDLPTNSDVNEEETSPYPAARSVEDVRLSYEELQARKGGKREVVDRILEGDWRHGITLAQLAMADVRYLEDHPAAQKWTAFRLVSADNSNKKQQKQRDVTEESTTDLSACLPRLHAATFLSNLQREISPLVKAHYHLAKSNSFPLTFLRIFVTDSPYQYPRHNSAVYLDSSRIIYIAFPDSSPFIYTSATTITTGNTPPSAVGTDSRALRSIVRNAIARALSKQHERYELEATSLTAKSLATLIALRGPGRTNMANGAFSIFADAVIEGTPIDPRRPGTVSPDEYSASGSKEDTKAAGEENEETEGEEKRKPLQNRDSNDSPATKKRKLVVSSRFGLSGTTACPAALDRLDARLLDHLDDNDNDEPDDSDNNDLEVEGYLESGEYAMGLSLTGNNVIAGLRKLAELGMVDPNRMPSWMTGEEGVSSLVARRGERVVPDRKR
ncbi:uncharacterized protein TRUGW13939_03470 [Talaromyces rugulosus]|uniref:CHL4 family chromosome segregation protein n=1 Tax=Talaromyces rugulosus TaxID=121627 RepID=A0A7H8QR73_TALRU|nr:uncharacterized protein TRUGW13939_03470 [Talaromyces rugulosus]QKX56369.1 hypothetical protein TRUGW13939_03470 [Talaromyces rugulosus]